MPLPNFLIIGAPRAGTTSLWRYCGEHPQIFMSRLKECCYFSYNDPAIDPPRHSTRVIARTLDEYRRLFDDARDEIAIGEASPQYLASLAAPARIKAVLPGVRLVVSLRHPAERAYSEYLLLLREGRVPRDPVAAFEGRPVYVRVSFYSRGLARFVELFGRDRLQVCLFDDLRSDAAGTMAGIFRFLDVDETFRPSLETRHNVGSVPRSDWVNRTVVQPLVGTGIGSRLPQWIRRLPFRSAPELPADLRARLCRLYAEDVLKVQDLIQRDLSAWLS